MATDGGNQSTQRKPAASLWQTSSHNVVSSTPHQAWFCQGQSRGEVQEYMVTVCLPWLNKETKYTNVISTKILPFILQLHDFGS
jgi:hypothetical protein